MGPPSITFEVKLHKMKNCISTMTEFIQDFDKMKEKRKAILCTSESKL